MKKVLKLIIIVSVILLVACTKEKSEDIKTAEINKVTVLLPQTPSSLPLYFALKDTPLFEVELFLNHSQANAKFLRGDAKLLLTGISVANSFSKQGVDFDLLSSQVDNLTHLVSNDQISTLTDIKDKTIVFPFADSPMEILFTKIAEKKQLIKDHDYQVQYMPFSTSLQLLQQGSDILVWLPEPFASLAESKFNLKINLSLDKLFRDNLADLNACQVVLLARDLDLRSMGAINYLAEVYIDSLKSQAEKFIARLPQDFPNRQAYNLNTIRRTSYNFNQGEDLATAIDSLYKLLDKENHLAERILELN